MKPVISLDNAAARWWRRRVNYSLFYVLTLPPFLWCAPRALTGVGTSGRAWDRCGPRSPSSSNCCQRWMLCSQPLPFVAVGVWQETFMFVVFRCRFATYLCLCQHKRFVHPELEQNKVGFFFSAHRVSPMDVDTTCSAVV